MPHARNLGFGLFRLDAGGRVLYRDVKRVALTPKAVDVLIALIGANGQPVGKDELLRTVWASAAMRRSRRAIRTRPSIVRSRRVEP